MYDIYGGKGVAGSPPVLIKEEKERKRGKLRNGEMQSEISYAALSTPITTCSFE